MNKKIICLGIVIMFLLTSITVLSAVGIKAIVTEDSSEGKISTLDLTGDDLRIQIKKDYVSVSIKNLKRLQQSTFEAEIHTKVIGKAENNPVIFSSTIIGEGDRPFGFKVAYNLFIRDPFFTGECEVTVTVKGLGEDEGLYKELIAEGEVTRTEIIVYADSDPLS